MCKINSIDVGLCNGRLGRLVDITDCQCRSCNCPRPKKERSTTSDDEKKAAQAEAFHVTVIWDENPDAVVMYRMLSPTKCFSLSYLLTVHKMQGSETDVVVMLLTEVASVTLYHSMIYTALSRGRQKLILIGSYENWSRAVSYDKPIYRHFSEKWRELESTDRSDDLMP